MDVENKVVNKKKNNIRRSLVLAFVIIYLLITYIEFRGSFLEYLELGENYISVFWTNLKCKYIITGVSFVVIYFIMYLTNRGIKKGLKPFFDDEKKEMPKFPNKSLSLVIATIVSFIISIVFSQKILLYTSNALFEMQEPIFNLDISYYMLKQPVLELCILYAIVFLVGITAYMAIYYIIVFNKYLDGIDKELLKKSLLVKKILRNVKLLAIFFATYVLLGTQDILVENFLTTNSGVEFVGAGLTEVTIKLWGDILFSIIVIVSIFLAVKNIKQENKTRVIKNLAIIPTYLVGLFLVMVVFQGIFVKGNEFDKEREYIEYNISNTKNAYGIDCEEELIEYTGTITQEDVNKNSEIINNTVIVSKESVVKTLKDTQTQTGYYTYRNATIGKYKVEGKLQLVYLSPREIASSSIAYNSKTYEYTHGYGEVITSATSVTDSGEVKYIQNDITGEDNVIQIKNSQIYFGLETNDAVVVNAKGKNEYDYVDMQEEKEYSYEGDAGLTLGFFDRLVLAIKEGNLKLVFSTSVTSESKILINRNILERAKKALPYVMYDEEPYTVIDSNGNIYWVIDAYTTSNNYPYSTHTDIEYNGEKQEINYIRNSIKIIVNAYNGDMKFYIIDRTDPIAMAYRNIYPELFEEIESEIPEDIACNFVYPKFLYDIQATMIENYHNVKSEVLYRGDDIWEKAKHTTTVGTKTTTKELDSYYTMCKDNTIGLIQIFTPTGKQNISSYLVGTCEDGKNILKINKLSSDTSILGPMQIEKEISQNEAIQKEIDSINVSGSKITKKLIIIPIENTLLNVEAIYQTMTNESDIPILKKIVVASGNKIAIGNNLNQALENLLSQSATNIEIDTTDDIEGLLDAIIKANKNLKESNESNNWELIGSDIQKLQELINSLEKLKKAEEKQEIEQEDEEQIESNNSVNDNKNILNVIE